MKHSTRLLCCVGVCSAQIVCTTVTATYVCTAMWWGLFHYSAYDISQTCFNRGVETVVVPKTSATAESGWMGLAKYAWSGYVNSYLHCTANIFHLIFILQSTVSETVCVCTRAVA